MSRNQGRHDSKPTPNEPTSFLPNFCSTRMVVTAIIIAELLAMLLTLANSDEATDRWAMLGMLSLFTQWVAHLSIMMLCLLRRVLWRLGNIGAALLSYLLLMLVAAVMTETAFRALYELTSVLDFPLGTHADFLLRNIGIAALVNGVALRYFYVSQQMRRHLHAQANARFEALQLRIRPHFLFNSLNTIAALIRSEPKDAETAVEDLADLFRATLAEGRLTIPLEEELELVRRYLRMEKLRLDQRLNIAWQLDELPMGAYMPSLLLQPLVENAVYHGIEPLPQGGTITLEGHANKNSITFIICNPVARRAHQPSKGNRIALENISARLKALYGDEGKIEIEDAEGRYCVTLRIPREETKGQQEERTA